MDPSIFIVLVAFMALCYAGLSKVLQSKMIDKEGMKRFQEESKSISKQLEEARKSKDQKRIDAAMQKQMDMLPQMNKVMMGQLKMMAITIVIFMAIYWVLGQLDPSSKDDLHVTLLDDGSGCDALSGDGVFTHCQEAGPASGKWMVHAKAIGPSGELGTNTTYFIVGDAEDSDTWVDAPQGGSPPQVKVEEKRYAVGEQVLIEVTDEGAQKVELALDQGTAFIVDLPLSIPLIDFQRIRHPQVFFIIMSLVFNISISAIMNLAKKQGLVKA